MAMHGACQQTSTTINRSMIIGNSNNGIHNNMLMQSCMHGFIKHKKYMHVHSIRSDTISWWRHMLHEEATLYKMKHSKSKKKKKKYIASVKQISIIYKREREVFVRNA